MPLLVLPFPAFDPILVSFGPFAVRWYALAYIVGILLGWYLRASPYPNVRRCGADNRRSPWSTSMTLFCG